MATIPEALAAAIQHHQAGRLEMAERMYRQILALQPDQPDALHLLGVIAHQSGRHEAAIESIEAAIRLREDDPVFHHNLGEAYRALHQYPEAIACYQRAVQLRPDYAKAYSSLGTALISDRRPHEAIACCQCALELRPRDAVTRNNLGNVFWAQGLADKAIACYRQAIEDAPARAEIHANLGNALGDLGQFSEAAACIQKAMQLDPDSPAAHDSMGTLLKDQGLISEAIGCFERALQLNPNSAATHSNLLLTLQCRAGIRRDELAEAHAVYELRHAASLRQTWRPHENSPDPDRPLRLGFISPDFACHPVGFFLIQALENLRQLDCETVCYYTAIRQDRLTARFRSAARTWRDVYSLNDDRLAEQIRGDGIDILLDLSGHTAGNRLLVFARKPAPIQITWIGYEGTTGLEAIDYILANRHVIPEGTESDYRERVLRMPDGYVCYDPPADAPPAGALPAVGNGRATFGSFNNPAKIGPEVIAVWAEILRRTPESRLVLKYRGFDDETVRRRYFDLFAGQGIEPARLLLLPAGGYDEYLASYRQLDVALDPFPFSGGATTCDALWMGVPVITCPGETFASRHGLSHLSNVGLADEFVAHDLDQYVELAVRWAGDLERLAAVRASLRDRMAASPLCDGRRFAANLMRLLRDAWRGWAPPARAPGLNAPG